MTRGSEQEIALAVKSVTRNLSLLADSKSFMLAMSHVGSLRQKAMYDNGVAPNTVADWDRKTWSLQNFVTIPGVSFDPGNFALATMFLSLRHAVGMEPKIDRNELGELDESGDNRPAKWPSEKCTRHPIKPKPLRMAPPYQMAPWIPRAPLVALTSKHPVT